ncbi:MAG: hypothetical protein KIT60_20130 [Burkholderiaceae bacterium]|nr:hypothetical protein [Burkholderiaceae bacterium]
MRMAAALLACAALAGPVRAQDELPDLQTSGHFKSLLMRSQTFAGERITLDLNRARIEVKGALAPALRLDLQVDNEVLLGSYLHTAQFRQTKDAPAPQYWSAEANSVERRDLYAVHRLYRGTLQFTAGNTDVRIGRQRIAWGTGRFWSPLDLLNRFSPVTLEREQRIGVDAVLVEHKVDALSRASAVYAPSRLPGGSSRALQWHGNLRAIDHSLTVGRFGGADVLGLDLAGQLDAAGVRAELTRTRPPAGAAFWQALLGVDYAFANTLTLSAEAYHDGSGEREPARYDFAALLSGQRRTLARHYAGLRTSYEITPLLKLIGEFVANLDDSSRYIGPRLAWSWRPNVELSVGLQRFGGRAGSELARFPDVTYAQLQWYF